MKTNTKIAAVAAFTLLATTAAHAATLSASKYQETTAQNTSSSPMQDTMSNDKVKEPANVQGGNSMDNSVYSDDSTNNTAAQPKAGDDMAADTSTMGSAVKVKLADGKIISVNDSADTPWNRSPDLKGYDRFTFDPVNNIYVAGKGDAEFASNWDENGNRIAKVVKVVKKTPKKTVVKSDADATTETTTESTTTEETPATPADDSTSGSSDSSSGDGAAQ